MCKPLSLPLTKKILNQKLYHIHGRISEICATVRDFRHAAELIPTTFCSTCLTCPVHKRDGSWKVIADFRKVNQMVSPIAAALPHISNFTGQINTQLLSLGMLLVIQQMLFSPYKLARNARSNLLLLGKANNITSQSCPRAMSIFLLSAIIQSTEMLSILPFQSALS